MTKAEIVQRLLDEDSITAEEAVVLLQQDIPEIVVLPQQPIAPLQPIPDWIGPGPTHPQPDYPTYPQPSYPGPFTDPVYPGPFGDWWRVTSSGNICPNGPGPCNCTGACKE